MRVTVPGDKSLTQRSLILATLAEGESRLSGLLHGGDAESTAGALRALGATIPALPADGSGIVVRGVGLAGLREPAHELDLGNSGTGTRLLLGVLAGTPIRATLTGDESLSARPMGRVTEPRRSRDHTELLFGSVGVAVSSGVAEGGWRVALTDPPDRIEPLDFAVPGDVSSSAFLLALAVLGGAGASLTVDRVGLNPTRTAFLDVLGRMGAKLVVEPDPSAWGQEPVGRVTVAPAKLRGVEVGADEVPRLIDELPLVAALGAMADGTTTISGAEELRAKESDRITAMVDNLRALGVRAQERPDGLVVEGTDAPLVGRIRTRADHRIAMAFGVLGAVEGNRIEVDDRGAADVSFPGFWALLERLAP